MDDESDDTLWRALGGEDAGGGGAAVRDLLVAVFDRQRADVVRRPARRPHRPHQAHADRLPSAVLRQHLHQSVRLRIHVAQLPARIRSGAASALARPLHPLLLLLLQNQLLRQYQVHPLSLSIPFLPLLLLLGLRWIRFEEIVETTPWMIDVQRRFFPHRIGSLLDSKTAQETIKPR